MDSFIHTSKNNGWETRKNNGSIQRLLVLKHVVIVGLEGIIADKVLDGCQEKIVDMVVLPNDQIVSISSTNLAQLWDLHLGASTDIWDVISPICLAVWKGKVLCGTRTGLVIWE